MAGGFDSGFSSGFDVGAAVAELALSISGDSSFSATLEASSSGDLALSIQGDSSFVVSLFTTRKIYAAGEAVLSLTLDNGFSELASSIIGEATFTANSFTSIEVPYQPVNYPLCYGKANIVELGMGVEHAEGNTVFSLDEGMEMEVIINGDATMTLGPPDNVNKFETLMEGDATFLAELFVTGNAELDMTVNGDAFFNVLASITDSVDLFDYPRSIYMYGNVITGFCPTDDLGYTQTCTDGNIIDFSRYLYQYLVVNVGFDYTDDISGLDTFISQSYPDGDIIRDFARYLYQYVNVTTEVPQPDCRLTVGPAPRSPKDLTPIPRPPRKAP